MAENDEPTPESDATPSAPAEETAVTQTPVTSEAVPAAGGPKFTDRLWNFRAMVAVALAALLLGGGLGAAIAAVSHDDRSERRAGFMRWDGGPGGPMMGPGMNGFGPGDRQQFRQDLKDMRQKMRQQFKQQLQNDKNAPTPSTPPTPSPSPNG